MSLGDGTKAANLCNLRYALCRDAVYVKHPWRFLKKREAPARDVTAPATEYAYQFSIPTDCLRIYQVTDASGVPYEDGYVYEGTKILSHYSVIYLNYIRREENVTFIPEYLAEVIALYLASDLAYALTQNASARDQMTALFQYELRAARGIDGVQDVPRSLNAYDWLDSRLTNWTDPSMYRFTTS